VLNIVVVEDFDALREELVWALDVAPWSAVGVGSGAALDRLLLKQSVDVVVLDLNLPGEDGLSIARRLRSAWPHMGIVMLTARGDHAQRASGFEAGADVYLAKPAQVSEIEAVIRNLERRIAVDATRRHHGGLLLDGDRLSLSDTTGRAIPLSAVEACLLRALDEALDRELEVPGALGALERAGFGVLSASYLRVLVSRFRAKAREVWVDTEIIKAVHGKGYRLAVRLVQL
jgi:DNA-binding response OmpR family regulator